MMKILAALLLGLAVNVEATCTPQSGGMGLGLTSYGDSASSFLTCTNNNFIAINGVATSTTNLNNVKASTGTCASGYAAQVLGNGSVTCTNTIANSNAVPASGLGAGTISNNTSGTASNITGNLSIAQINLSTVPVAGSCSLPNVLTAVNGGSAVTCQEPSNITGNANYANTAGGAPPTGSAGGDLTGSYPNPTLVSAGTTGSYGSASVSPTITTDSKGRVVAMSSNTITPSSIGALATGASINASQLTNGPIASSMLPSTVAYFNAQAVFTSTTPGAGNIFPLAPLMVQASTNNYVEVNVQNLSNGAAASSDLTATNDLGGSTSYYINVGINSSKYSASQWTATPSSGGYLTTSDSPLAIWAGINGRANGGRYGAGNGSGTPYIVLGASTPVSSNIAIMITTSSILEFSSMTNLSSGGIEVTTMTASTMTATWGSFTGSGASVSSIVLSSSALLSAGSLIASANAGKGCASWDSNGYLYGTGNACGTGSGGGGLSSIAVAAGPQNGPWGTPISSSAITFDSNIFKMVSTGTPAMPFLTISTSAGQNMTRTVLTSGSGTYYPPAGATQLRIRMVGGGGGGGGSYSTSTGGTNASPTVFGSTSAWGGNGGNGADQSPYQGGTGGGTSYSASNGGNYITCVQGGAGGSGGNNGVSSAGGNSAFGGGGLGSYSGIGGAGATNTGGGGGAGSNGTSNPNGSGGGAGQFCDLVINNPSASYSYSISTGATGGTATNYSGGTGASGIEIIDEAYPPISSGAGIVNSTNTWTSTQAFSNAVQFQSLSITSLKALVPSAVGQMFYCNNCSPLKAVISTGTSAGNFADPAGGTFK